MCRRRYVYIIYIIYVYNRLSNKKRRQAIVKKKDVRYIYIQDQSILTVVVVVMVVFGNTNLSKVMVRRCIYRHIMARPIIRMMGISN